VISERCLKKYRVERYLLQVGKGAAAGAQFSGTERAPAGVIKKYPMSLGAPKQRGRARNHNLKTPYEPLAPFPTCTRQRSTLVPINVSLAVTDFRELSGVRQETFAEMRYLLSRIGDDLKITAQTNVFRRGANHYAKHPGLDDEFHASIPQTQISGS